MDAEVSEDIDAVTEGVDIVVTTTPSRKPLVRRVSPGTHINAIGADAEGKEEIHPALLKSARIGIDDWAQASLSGEINVPLAKGEITEKDIHGTLGDIITGRKKGRSSKRRSPFSIPPDLPFRMFPAPRSSSGRRRNGKGSGRSGFSEGAFGTEPAAQAGFSCALGGNHYHAASPRITGENVMIRITCLGAVETVTGPVSRGGAGK
jgi:hypothetical protein